MLREISLDEAKQAVAKGETVYSLTEPMQDCHMVSITDDYNALFPADGRYLVDEPDQVKPEPDKPKGRGRPKNKNGRPKIDGGKLMALYNAGWSKQEIADEMNISLQTVYNYLKGVQDGKTQE